MNRHRFVSDRMAHAKGFKLDPHWIDRLRRFMLDYWSIQDVAQFVQHGARHGRPDVNGVHLVGEIGVIVADTISVLPS